MSESVQDHELVQVELVPELGEDDEGGEQQWSPPPRAPRSRSVSVSGAFSATGGLVTPRGGRRRGSMARSRSHSSSSANHNRRGSTGHLRPRGESIGDASALSVEVAVADASKQTFSPQHHHPDTRPSRHGRSMSMSVSSRALGASSSTSARWSRMMSEDRHRRSVTQVRPRSISSEEEEEEEEEEQEEEEEEAEEEVVAGERGLNNEADWQGQTVIRRHHPQRSMPSVLDLFNLTPAVPAASKPPTSLSPKDSNDAVVQDNRQPPTHSTFTAGHHYDQLESSTNTAAADAQQQLRRYESTLNLSHTREDSREQPDSYPSLPAAWLQDGGAPLSTTDVDGTVVETQASGEQQQRQQAQQQSVADDQASCGSVETAFTGSHHDPPATGSESGSGRARRRRSTLTLPWPSDEINGAYREPKGVTFDKPGEPCEQTVASAAGVDKGGGEAAVGSSGVSDEELVLAQRFRETLTNAVAAGGSCGDGLRRRQEDDHGGDADFDDLENGGRHHATLHRSETVKTTSQTETPTSKCGTPRSTRSRCRSSAGSQRSHSRGGSLSSSYHDSMEMVGRGGAMRRPSMRFQNEAKHVSDQKRGVTTSYKSEELYTQFHKVAIFLVVMGVIIGLGSHGIDFGIAQIARLGERIVDAWGGEAGGNPWGQFTLFWLYDVVLTCLAALVTSVFAPGVGGSGIPAMKYMMDTNDLANNLKSFTVVAIAVKACGLMLAAGGGLNIGREGPYTHMAGMVSYQLIKNVPFFHDILAKETVLRQVLAASVAVGVSSTFAATIGGVLFSIEITTLYYDVGNYFKAFVAAISGTVAVSLLRTLAEGKSEYIERSFSNDEFEVWQYPIFAVMGVFCGFLGPLYVNFRLHMLKLARKWGKHAIRADKKRRWEYVRAATSVAGLVATITAILTFTPGEFTRLTPLRTFKALLEEGDLPSNWSSGYLNSIFLSLPVSIVTWFITAALGTSVAVPSGDFIQTLVMGATIGRLIGEALAVDAVGWAGVQPSTFALVGAAALSCGATQTISAAVVTMEMTGSFNLDKPILLTAVVSFAFSRRFGLNIYDSVMALNGLESLYGLDMRRSEEMTAKDIMEADMHVVPCQTTIGELLELLRGEEGGAKMFESYPVVTGLEGMAFVGTISRKDLVHIVLTGGTKVSRDPLYFDYVIRHLPKKDVTASWDRMGEGLHSKDKHELFERLPSDIKHVVGPSVPSAANTVRALKILTDKIGNIAADMTFMRGGSTKTSGRMSGRVRNGGGAETNDPRDKNKQSSRMNLNTLLRAMREDIENVEDPFESRPVDLTTIAQRASGDVQIDRSVWKAHENMPLKNVYLLFANLRCIRLFVIAGDRLTGIISRSILYNALSHREVPMLGDSSSRSHFQRSHSSGRPSWSVSARDKKKRWFDVLLGRGPRLGW